MSEIANFFIIIGRALTENYIVVVSVMAGAFAIAIALFLCTFLIKRLNRNNKKVLLSFAIALSSCITIIFIFLILGLCGVYPPNTVPDNNDTIEISTIEIYVGDEKIEEGISKSFLDNENSIPLEIVINGSSANNDKVGMSLSFVGDALGCEINEDNSVSIGDTLGTVEILISVKGNNTLTKSIYLNIIAPTTLDLLEVKAVSPSTQKFIEGQIFIPSSEVKLQATFINALSDKFNVFVRDFIYDDDVVLSPSDSEIQLSYTHKTATRMCLLPIVVVNKTLQSIEIINPPINISYIEGQELSVEGMMVKANYEFVSNTIDNYIVTKNGEVVSPEITSFTVAYTENGITKSVSQNITVTPRTLQSITIDENPTYLSYIQGQYFNTSGLKATAHYEYMDLDITELLTYDITRRLKTGDTEISYSYTENGTTQTGKFSIEVFEPYTKTRTITLENPLDATLSWIYTYMNDDGEVCVDDTIFSPYDNLSYDQSEGIYTVPSGATVILSKVSPALSGFEIDGQSIPFVYPASTYEFFVPIETDNIRIDFTRFIGERTTIRFSSFGKGQNFAFIYPFEYSGTLSTKDLAQISQIYEENEEEYYTFTNGSNEYSFADLASLVISGDTVFIVEKQDRIDSATVTLELVFGDSSLNAVVRTSEYVSLNSLPQIDRIGYSLGFALTDGGELLNDTTFNAFLETAEDGYKLYAIYTLTAVGVTGEIVGEWNNENVSEQLDVTISFNADGTYSYVLQKDSTENCVFSGVYKKNVDETYSILSIESRYDYNLFSVKDFTLTINEDKLETIAFIQDLTELSILQENIALTKINP